MILRDGNKNISEGLMIGVTFSKLAIEPLEKERKLGKMISGIRASPLVLKCRT